jgi:hypothetical protein
VRTIISRLTLLMAVLLMPFGMASAPASSMHHAMGASMPMQHCPDEQAPSNHSKATFVECTMACSSALPATEAPPHEPPILVCTPVHPATVQRLTSLHPETATPPPRHS